MDATCFCVDWMGQTLGPSFAPSSGHWTHIVTCAHVICPWNYPNYYPPTGPTRYVSHITLGDTMTTVKIPSVQGTSVYKHFTSNHCVFVHSNPRLDLCVVHPEQNFKRSGEAKMMWLQNEGLIMRPRLELIEELNVGDYVWIYGMTADENLFDEEKNSEPKMLPTGIRGRVHHKTKEHFFVETLGVEGSDRGKVAMGMCGSVVMRNGKCVGMLTAMVHEESSCTALAGTSMCTYASDIFEFLLEVERQMKTLAPKVEKVNTIFEERRRSEGRSVSSEPKDWQLDQTRLARHVSVPKSLFHPTETWALEEDRMANDIYGRSGMFNQETQENALGYDMQSSSTSRPEGSQLWNSGHHSGKYHQTGERPDNGPRNIHMEDDVNQKSSWDASVNEDIRSLFNVGVDDPIDAAVIDTYRKSMEAQRQQADVASKTESAFKNSNEKNGAGISTQKFEDERAMNNAAMQAFAAKAAASQQNSSSSNEQRSSQPYGSNTEAGEAAPLKSEEDVYKQIHAAKRAAARQERDERERKYQAELKARLGPRVPAAVETEGLWRDH